MVVHEHPGIDDAFRLLNGLPQPLKKSGFILGIAEDVSPINSPNHDMM